MKTIHLNGADAVKIAEKMGGTLIMVNESADTALISGGDSSKLMAKVSVKQTICKVCGQVETMTKFCFIENGEHYTYGSEFVDPQLVKVGC